MNERRREPDGVRPVLREVRRGVQGAEHQHRDGRPQNEPNYSQGYPSALWDSTLYTTFVKTYLGPALNGMNVEDHARHDVQRRQRRFKQGPDGHPERDGRRDREAALQGHRPAVGHAGSLQGQAVDVRHSSIPSGRPSTSAATTRGTTGYPGFNAEPAPNDQAYAVESWGYIRDAIKAGVTAYNAWNMVLDTAGKGNDTVRQWTQDALLIVNTSSKTLTLTPAYHVFRHVSQYVKPTRQGRRDQRQHRRDRVQEPGRQRRRHRALGRCKRVVQRADQGHAVSVLDAGDGLGDRRRPVVAVEVM